MGVATGRQFLLPDVGEGLTEAEIVNWRVAVGDQVKVNDPLVEIETAKSLVELPSPYAGVVGELLVAAGELVPVGTPIVTITEDGQMAKPEKPADPGIGKPDDERPPSTLVGYGPSHSRGRSRRRPPLPPSRQPQAAAPSPAATSPIGSGPQPAAQSQPSTSPVAARAEGERPRAKPPVRKLAKDLGIDLGAVMGSGREGVITREDVLSASERPAQVNGSTDLAPSDSAEWKVELPAAARTTHDDEHIPVRGVRAATAAAMTASAFTAPHVTVFHTIDVTKSVKLVDKLRRDQAFEGSRVTIMLLAARALCLVAHEYPDLNATFDQAAKEIVLHHRVNLGVATASERGLLVPTVEDAGAKGLPALARELTRVTELARAGTASPAQLTGSTITLTNIGVFGVDSGTPILNPGQSAILCLGSVRRAPAEHKGRVELRWTTQLAMSFDHRIIDGQQGAKALARIGAILRNPRRELLLV
ncbi:dihydrolipoamide acetyltransferase family protein [Kineosporia babensis]|uniref:Dihydrolipoamide acetyltransferase component of pyruvate dehydrogenase complex n=1 Tax=Kineosporia babensis TaxID=499548 RepID=A0A9X1NG47_9ACTN|nr:dihydrolipoamide acetyltransferase family protein [Kineosporia babensis]MCD5314492.1 2-oxo acid dehydrogenase subunit E2 [Kineosporia babensis]